MMGDTKNRRPASAGDTGRYGPANAASASVRRPVRPLKFFSEVRQEGRKVTWTSRNETIISTIMVAVVAAIAAVFFLIVDWVIGVVVSFLLGFGG